MSGVPGSAHGSASAGWAVVTAGGIVQSRCGRIDGQPPIACSAWRLRPPGGSGVAFVLALRQRIAPVGEPP